MNDYKILYGIKNHFVRYDENEDVTLVEVNKPEDLSVCVMPSKIVNEIVELINIVLKDNLSNFDVVTRADNISIQPPTVTSMFIDRTLNASDFHLPSLLLKRKRDDRGVDDFLEKLDDYSFIDFFKKNSEYIEELQWFYRMWNNGYVIFSKHFKIDETIGIEENIKMDVKLESSKKEEQGFTFIAR